nr:RHS repeat-associated core domain-containing protein [Delftia sp. PE138]
MQKQERARQGSVAIHHYNCDHLGTPMALTDQTGQVAWAAKLDPWGNVLQEYNPQCMHQAIRLPGPHHNKETGLYYNRHRYYDPVVGSYVNQDPIGLMGGMNKFRYGNARPLEFIDPLGLDGWQALAHAFCPNGSCIPATPEPWYMNSGSTTILNQTHNDMKSMNLMGGDQFFHCMAFCRVSKSKSANTTWAKVLGNIKEARDIALNTVGLYGAGKLSFDEILADSKGDLIVNDYGLSCPQNKDCSEHCDIKLPAEANKTRAVLRSRGY